MGNLLAGATNTIFATLLVMFALTIQSSYTAISGLYKAELFPTEIGALGVGLPYSIGISTIGGTAEVVALSLKQQGVETWFYWYVTGFMALCLLTSLLMFDTKKHSKILED